MFLFRGPFGSGSNSEQASERANGSRNCNWGTSSCKHQLPCSFATGGFEYIHYTYHILYPRLLWMTIPKWVLCWYVRTPETSFHCNLMNTSAHAEGWSERGGEARSGRGDQTGISGRYRETCMKRWESDPVRSFLFFLCSFLPDELWPRLDEQQSRRCIPSGEIIDKNRQFISGPSDS